jgi:hypothetical protein
MEVPVLVNTRDFKALQTQNTKLKIMREYTDYNNTTNKTTHKKEKDKPTTKK